MKKRIRNFFLKQDTFEYAAGNTVIRLGDAISGVYYIQEGYVKVYSLTEAGEENIQFIHKPGEMFPIIWSFCDDDADVSYEALTPLILKRATKDDFLKFLHSDPEVMFLIVQHVAGHLRSLYVRMNNLAFTHSYPRIISCLLYYAKDYGKEEKGKIVFDFPINQKDIANSVNISRETASKEMSSLEKKGIIHCSNRSVLVINSLEKLEEELVLYYKSKSS